MNAFWDVQTSPEAVYKAEPEGAFRIMLTKTHALPLSQDGSGGHRRHVYYNFYWFGPSINYNSSSTRRPGAAATWSNYADLMMQTDGAGVNRSYLATEETFQVLKDLEERNLLVPVVGNFGGPKALRAVGKYLTRARRDRRRRSICRTSSST